MVGVLAMIAVISALILVQRGGTTPGPSLSPGPSRSPGASPTVDPSAFPNSDETALLTMLPGEVAGRCARGTYALVRSDRNGAQTRPRADLACVFSGTFSGGFGVERMEVIQLRESTLITADSVVAQTVVDHSLPPGDCEVDAPAVGTWSVTSQEIGAVACYLEGGNAVIEWAYQELGLIVRAYRSNNDESGISTWWVDNRGTIGSGLTGPTASEAAFPTAAEEALLATIPSRFTTACERGSYDLLKTDQGGTTVRPIASVSCAQPSGQGPAELVVDFLQLMRSNDLTADSIVAATAKAYGAPAGDCANSGRAAGRWSVGDREVGSIVCSRAANLEAFIEWSYDAKQLLARTHAQSDDERPLYTWWAQNARLIAP